MPGGLWTTYAGFIGWVGPYNLPAYQMDRYEVTNSEFEKFVESGGYEKAAYWPEFDRDGKTVDRAAAMAEFRDTTGRPGPATWAGGHYPEGEGNFPVAGVSWYEAMAYAAWAGKSLPVLGQWYKAADPDMTEYTAQESNMGGTKVAAVGAFHGLGTYGTEDTAGNVREWVVNEADAAIAVHYGRIVAGDAVSGDVSRGADAVGPFGCERVAVRAERCAGSGGRGGVDSTGESGFCAV